MTGAAPRSAGSPSLLQARACAADPSRLLISHSIMARTASISDDRLLQAARAEFLAHGIRATTAAIARRARVSPGILFHRFGSKEKLFAAAMGGQDTSGPLAIDLRDRAGKGSVQETLTEFGELLLDRFFIVVPNQVMAWANPDPNRRVNVAEQYRERGVRGQKVFVEYLRAEARRGRIRPIDPFVVAQTFSGALWFFVFEQVSGTQLRDSEAPSRQEFVRRLVDTLWRGLRP